MIEIFIKGGPIMWPLLALSLIAFTVVLERFVFIVIEKWRRRPSLYGTVVSEFMLQQTQVKTVLPYFARWLEARPDFRALAAAPEAKVLKLWEGLGYYSRARNLHRLAQAVAARPEPPRDEARGSANARGALGVSSRPGDDTK